MEHGTLISFPNVKTLAQLQTHSTSWQELSGSISQASINYLVLASTQVLKSPINEAWGYIYRDEVTIHLPWPLTSPHESWNYSLLSHANRLVHAQLMLTWLLAPWWEPLHIDRREDVRRRGNFWETLMLDLIVDITMKLWRHELLDCLSLHLAYIQSPLFVVLSIDSLVMWILQKP